MPVPEAFTTGTSSQRSTAVDIYPKIPSEALRTYVRTSRKPYLRSNGFRTVNEDKIELCHEERHSSRSSDACTCTTHAAADGRSLEVAAVCTVGGGALCSVYHTGGGNFYCLTINTTRTAGTLYELVRST